MLDTSIYKNPVLVLYTAPNTADKTRNDAFFSMSLVVLASCPDLCDHDALRTLADTQHPIFKLQHHRPRSEI